jgi:lysyl-tRNA synthetase class 2
MSDQPQQPVDENRLIAERREKLAAWRATGKAFPNDFSRENLAGKLDELYSAKTREELEATPIEVKVAGRIMLKRVMGKASFASIQDVSGRIQIFVSNDITGETYTSNSRAGTWATSSAASARCSRPRPAN